jgi:hypothetical protein
MEQATLQSDTALPLDVGTPIVVASHPRSGTHLTLDLLRKQFRECKASLGLLEPLSHLYLNLDGLAEEDERYSTEDALDLLRRADRPTVKTHTLPTLDRFGGKKRELARAVLKEGHILYPIRDCRDVICSMYLWERERHPEYDSSLSAYLRDPPNRISQPAERQDHDLNYLQKWARHVLAWKSISDVRVLKFEDILNNPRSVIQSIGRWVDLSPRCETPLLPEKRTSTTRWDNYWRRLTHNHESTAVVGRSDSDRSLDWEEAFSEEDRRYVHDEAGELLIQLGYEEDDGWVTV